ncbi:arylsulfatase [Saccharomonospora sp. NPDC046836]|uniref:arylsulfatase n=1 Tax=Saccharomonospora sp. NPDC046836 TaxID=3156921 RepID=UPI003401460A
MTRPNVLVILADDLGYSDIGAFGGEIDTPNLDRLAGSGVRMTSFYVTPRCSPSRASLLTGRHPHSVGIGVLTDDDRPRGYPGSLALEAPTLAERLKAEGYATALVGKWHLSSDVHTPNETWPTRRGFDEFYGILPGCSSYYQPPLVDGEERLPRSATSGDYYFTDDLTRRACDFIERSSGAGDSWFLYLAYTAPHWPLHAREADIAKYRERFAAGWDRLREQRLRRQQDLGIASTDRLPERDERVPSWEDVPEHEWEAERMATYAAQVEAMDRGIGEIVGRLEDLGIAEDTLIVFSSDNGACAERLPSSDVRWAFSPDICPRTTRDGRPVRVGDDRSIKPGPEAGYTSYGRSWAHLSNTPFRLYKRWVHEGGISSPLISAWPAGGLSASGAITAPAHIVDIVPTILSAVGAEAADLPGADLLPVWRGDAPRQRTLCWEHVGNAAVRRGEWKLVREAGRPWELYDLSADRAERHDLSAERPALVAELERVWEAWAAECGVLAWEDLLADYRARGREQIIASET